MFNILFDHSPTFVIGELILALSLGMFAFALVGAVRERYTMSVPEARVRGRPTR